MEKIKVRVMKMLATEKLPNVAEKKSAIPTAE